jgi:hypothetical protein
MKCRLNPVWTPGWFWRPRHSRFPAMEQQRAPAVVEIALVHSGRPDKRRLLVGCQNTVLGCLPVRNRAPAKVGIAM